MIEVYTSVSEIIKKWGVKMRIVREDFYETT